MGLEVLTTSHAGAWQQVLERCAPFDFYHLPGYHHIAEQAGDGEARLFVYVDDGVTIALPLLLRSLDKLHAAQVIGSNWWDATSVYGYAGPVCSHAQIKETTVNKFQAALWDRLKALRVVTVFSRLHPLLSQHPLIAGLGNCAFRRTVAIDLTLPLHVQNSQYRRSDNARINKLRRQGLTIHHDQTGVYLQDFSRIYHESMERLGAAKRYFFGDDYFHQLWQTLGSAIHLFVCKHQEKVTCAGLFVACNGILQYHLGATASDALPLSSFKLLIDEVRLWANEQGLHTFHLGGGTTPDPDDSLLYFKLGFSQKTLEFSTWRWVVIPAIHDRLCAEIDLASDLSGLQWVDPDYFPAYRRPALASPVTA